MSFIFECSVLPFLSFLALPFSSLAHPAGSGDLGPPVDGRVNKDSRCFVILFLKQSTSAIDVTLEIWLQEYICLRPVPDCYTE
jgi:hypothetical protein